VWLSISSLKLSTTVKVWSGVPDQDQTAIPYVSNSPIGTIDWALLRGYGPDLYEVTTVFVDSLVAKEAVYAGEVQFRFRSRSISFLDKDGRIVGAWRHKRVVEGEATIKSRSNGMSMT